MDPKVKGIQGSIRTGIEIEEHCINNVHSTDFPGSYPGYDDAWNLKKFKQGFSTEVKYLSDTEIEFDMIGVDASVANAFRRIILSEVPTMAIDKVMIENNTSLVDDEQLAHRLGLVPILADPRLFEYKTDADYSAENTIEFTLKVKCKRNPNAPKDATDHNEMYLDHLVTTNYLKWVPIGNQASIYKEGDLRPVNNDIVLAKLVPGQEIDLTVHAVKGIGQEHAKFSPGLASYRLMPEITLLQEVVGDTAERLQQCFAPGVIDIVESDGRRVARVADARKDTCNRDVFRHSDLKYLVKLNKIRNHFIFLVESYGAITPDVLVLEGIKILKEKCSFFRNTLKELQNTASGRNKNL